MSEIKDQNEVSFTDYLSVILKWKKFLIINLLVISIIVTGITFLIPEKYKANATVMIQESTGSGLLGGMLKDVGGVFSKAFGGGSGDSEDKLFGFLASNQMAENIIEKFNLVEYYEIEKYKRDKTLIALKDDFKFDLNDNGFIEINMIHKDPEISAEIVNYATAELDKMNQVYATTYAKKYRQFVETRYFKNMSDIKDAEISFEQFQKETGVYAIPEQIEASFKAYAELEIEQSLKELERDLIRETQGEDNPSFSAIDIQVKMLNKKINELKSGKSSHESIVFLKIANLPSAQRKFLQIRRELEIQAKLLEFTLPMYEQAVMEEQKTIPAITVIDKAVAPELKDSPKKAFIILSIFLIALFIHLPFVFRGYKLINVTPNNSFEIKEKRFFEKIMKIYNIQVE